MKGKGIYEYHTFELRKYELDRKKIIAVIDTTFAVIKRKPEKIKSNQSKEMAGVKSDTFPFLILF